MAVTLGSYDFTLDTTPPPPRGSRRYPWAEWFDGQIWRITEGEDFLIDRHIMERTLRSRASDKNLLVKIRHEVVDGVASLVFQATPKEGAELSPGVVEEAPATLPADDVAEAPTAAPVTYTLPVEGDHDFGDVVEHRIVRPKLPI